MTSDHKDVINHSSTGKGSTGTGGVEAQQLSLAKDIPQNLANNLLEKISDRANLLNAWKAVKRNKGAPGTDGRTIKDVEERLDDVIEGISIKLNEGNYKPSSVKGVAIPKPDGNERLLGIPNIEDRIVQQAIAQILTPIFDPYFSDHSYGFRPDRSAGQAIEVAADYVKDGYDIVVDIDVEKFFDRVNHDILMSKLAKSILDKPLLKLIRLFLQAGMMKDGVKVKRDKGMPQGGPLSPLLSNIFLHVLDIELSRRGHKFVRYADDCNIYVKSELAGRRVLKSITEFLARKLKLQVNKAKSSVGKPRKHQFLGFTITNLGEISISKPAVRRIKNKIRIITSRNRGRKIDLIIKELNQVIRGWFHYFKPSYFGSIMKKLDCWIRRRLRCYRLKQRKRKYSIKTFLTGQGISESNSWSLACSNKGWWRKSLNPVIHKALNLNWFKSHALFSLFSEFAKHKFKTAVCDNACTVV